MRKRKALLYSVMTALCLTLLGGCSSSDADATTDTGTQESYWENQQYDSFTGSDFVEVASSGDMRLLLNPESGTIRWMDAATGAYQDTNMSHSEGMQNLSNRQRSDVVVTYFSGTKKNNVLYNTTSSYDSFSMCVDLGQLSYQKIDNGVRIIYNMGNDDITYKNFPLRISDERMQEFVLQYLDESQIALMKGYYAQLSDGRWQRSFNTNDQNKIGPMALREIENFFYNIGTYTIDELYVDLETEGVDPAEYPGNLFIRVPVEYYLEGEQLVVNVDTKMIETGADNPINKIDLIPYFLTSAADQDLEDGYMFIPDGSGALIYLDSDKVKEYHFAGTYYNGDKLVDATVYSQPKSMMLPVFGMKTSNSTIFGVIENGAEVATMDAYVSGQDNSEPFCKVKLSFDIQTQQKPSTGASSGSASNFDLYKATSDVYDDNITLRYYWLGEDADYVDMANCYADYLETKGMASEQAEDEAPFYVELMGSTDKTQFMLGIPYKGKQALTTFDQAKEILTDLTGLGIKNVKLIYTGMVNGGMNQRALTDGVKLASGLGGSSAWKSLKSYADSVGAQIFPNVTLQTAHTKKGLSKSVVAWDIVNQRAQIYDFDPVKREVDEEDEYPVFVINPNYLGKYLSKAKTSYTKKIGLSTMASDDFFSFIPTNYQATEVSPSTGKAIMNEVAAQMTDGLTLMLSNPIGDAYAYSNYLTDIPTEDSGMRILDASIPFIEMVLDGRKTYSSESLNLESTDVYANFMHVLEGNSVPKFTFMYGDSSLLSKTKQEDRFAVDYSYWKDRIGAYYDEYQSFHNAVKGAVIVEHELYERNEYLRVVTYSNGVKVYFNYSDLDETIDGVAVPALSYVIK